MGAHFGTLLYQIALRRTQNSHDWEASKAADLLFSPPQNQFPVAGGTVVGFASSAFSCSLFNICKTQSIYFSPIDYRSAIVYHRTEERERERVHVTLLLIKLWSAMTLRMREERYITNIISFVLTAQGEEKD